MRIFAWSCMVGVLFLWTQRDVDDGLTSACPELAAGSDYKLMVIKYL